MLTAILGVVLALVILGIMYLWDQRREKHAH